jgi:hypothetical protein
MASSGRTAPGNPPPSASCWDCCGQLPAPLGSSAAIRGLTRPRCTAGSRTSPAKSICGRSSPAVR